MAEQEPGIRQRGFTPLSLVLIVVLPLFAGFAALQTTSSWLVAGLGCGTFLFWLIHEHFLVPAAGARDPSATDRGTIRFLSITKLVAWVVGPALALLTNPAVTWDASQLGGVMGVVVMWLGIALRRWSIWTLGVFFRRDIAVQEGHRVIQRGPYRVVRHPSYSGDLLTFLGLGAALANWSSVVVCFVPPLIGYGRRLLVEEEVLGEGLGEEYASYKGRTRWRLVPGVW